MILNPYAPYCESMPTTEIDKITVVSQIIDKRFPSSTDEDKPTNYPHMHGSPAIFLSQQSAMHHIMEFQSMLSEMLGSPVDYEIYSYTLYDFVQVDFILREEPKEEEPETPEDPLDPEQPVEETEEPETTEEEM